MSNSLDPVQAGHFVGPDLGPNCLQNLSADDTCMQEKNKQLETHPHGSPRYFIPIIQNIMSLNDFCGKI